MKSEERHHLHENDLASMLDRWLRKFEPQANRILIGVLVVAVLAVGFLVWRRTTAAAAAKAWGEVAAANSADAFLTVADDHPHTEVAAWAQLRAGELFLAEGLRSATSDRTTAEERLGNAEKAFQNLLRNERIPPRVRERALYGLAVCRESLAGADTQRSIAAYEELLRAFPDSQYAGLAERRIAALKSEATREFYAWFDKQPRRPEDRPKPKDLTASSSGSTGDDPLFWLGNQPPTRPAHPDRPPSPSTPIRAGGSAPPFPDDAGAKLPEPTAPSAQTPANDAPPETAPPPSPTDDGERNRSPEGNPDP